MHLIVQSSTVRKVLLESLGAAVGLFVGYVAVLALVAVFVWIAHQ
jgi:hypothetical protein